MARECQGIRTKVLYGPNAMTLRKNISTNGFPAAERLTSIPMVMRIFARFADKTQTKAKQARVLGTEVQLVDPGADSEDDLKLGYLPVPDSPALIDHFKPTHVFDRL